MRFALMAVMVAAALWALPSGAQSQAKKIQCWTDKSGQRMCGDRVPPEYAGQKRDVIKDGRVVDTVKPVKTAEEVAAEKRKKQADEEARMAADYDRALLESYRSASDITQMRDDRLALVDSRISSAEKNAADTDKSLTGLRARAEAAQQKNEPVDDRLAKQIRQFEKAQQQNTKALERYRTERAALLAKFDRDYARYNELRGAKATTQAPATSMPTQEPAPAQKTGG